MREKRFSRVSGIGLLVLSVYFFLSLGMSIFGLSAALLRPSEILWTSYSFASFFLPIYLLITGLSNYRQRYNRDNFFLLNISIIPLLTLIVFYQTLSGVEDARLTESIIFAFGRMGTLFLSLAMFIFELILIFRIYSYLRSPRSEADADLVLEQESAELPETSREKEPQVKIYKVSTQGPEVYYPEENDVAFTPLDEQEKFSAKETPDHIFEPDLMGSQILSPAREVFEISEPEVPEPSDPPIESFEDLYEKTDPAIDILSDDDIAYLEQNNSASENDTIKEFRSKLEEKNKDTGILHLSRKNDKLQVVNSKSILPAEPEQDILSHNVFDELKGDGDLEEMAREFDTDEEKSEDSIAEESTFSEEVFSEGLLSKAEEDSFTSDYDAGQFDDEEDDDGDLDDEIEEEDLEEDIPVEEEKLPALPPDTGKNNWKGYKIPIDGLLNQFNDQSFAEIDEQTTREAEILKRTLAEFNIQAEVTGIRKGPVITMFEILPAAGVKLSKIVNLADNIALGLAASSVRIVAPIPGKHAVGIEVPNKKRSIVAFGDILAKMEGRKMADKAVPFVLGKNIMGDDLVIDIARTPHLLIAGSTGSGKSVCVNTLICSLLYERSPEEVKLILVDPKIVELKLYNGIPHLLTPVITEPKKAFQAIQWALYEMEKRYALLDAMGVRDIKTYNRRIKERKIATLPLPFIVLVVDEFADLMATSGKELEAILARLAAMSRAVGIHLVLATQRPSIDVITGLIKANFPSRIAFMVASKTDSRIILDSMGAEKLLGRGDMLFTSAWDPFPTRIQGSFLSEEEVENVVAYVKTLGEPDYIDDEIFIDDEEGDSVSGSMGSASDDPLYDKALDIVLTAGKASASYIQRRLSIGYNRAARLVEEMEIRGIVGPQNGSKPREIIHFPDRGLDKDPVNTENVE